MRPASSYRGARRAAFKADLAAATMRSRAEGIPRVGAFPALWRSWNEQFALLLRRKSQAARQESIARSPSMA